MNKFKDNKIVFDMFYDFNSFEKYIENNSENLEPISFKSYDEYGYEQIGEVSIANKKEIKVNFNGSNEGLLDRISLKLRKKNYNYYLKDDNININRLFNEKSFEKITERNENFKNFICEALNMDFPNENFKYINTDKNGNVSKAVVINNEIEELSYKNFNYVKGMDNALLNLTSENQKLIPVIQNYTNALNEYQKVNITLNQPEDVVFNLDIGKIDVELKKDFPKNLSESIQLLNTYKNVSNPDNCIDVTLHKEGKPILGNSYYEEHSQNKTIVNEAFNLWSQKEVDASLIKEAKQISDYENKDFFIFDEFNSIELLIFKGKIELQPDDFKLLNVPLKEKNQKMKDFAQKVGLDKIFEKVIYKGVENKQDKQKEIKNENIK